MSGTLGALAAGFLAGYVIADLAAPDDVNTGIFEISSSDFNPGEGADESEAVKKSSASPRAAQRGAIDGFRETLFYDHVRKEARSIGDEFLRRVSGALREALLPAVIAGVRHWLNKGGTDAFATSNRGGGRSGRGHDVNSAPPDNQPN